MTFQSPKDVSVVVSKALYKYILTSRGSVYVSSRDSPQFRILTSHVLVSTMSGSAPIWFDMGQIRWHDVGRGQSQIHTDMQSLCIQFGKYGLSSALSLQKNWFYQCPEMCRFRGMRRILLKYVGVGLFQAIHEWILTCESRLFVTRYGLNSASWLYIFLFNPCPEIRRCRVIGMLHRAFKYVGVVSSEACYEWILTCRISISSGTHPMYSPS